MVVSCGMRTMARGRVGLVFRVWIIWGRDDSVIVSLGITKAEQARYLLRRNIDSMAMAGFGS